MARGETYQLGPISGIEIIGPAEYGNWSKKLVDASYPIRYGCGHTGRETHRKIQSYKRYTMPRLCDACKRADTRALSQREEFLRQRIHSDVPSLTAQQWPAPPSVIAAQGGGDG